jgi:hypothetical protein
LFAGPFTNLNINLDFLLGVFKTFKCWNEKDITLLNKKEEKREILIERKEKEENLIEEQPENLAAKMRTLSVVLGIVDTVKILEENGDIMEGKE